LLALAVSVIAWGIKDRIEWAERARQMDVNTESIRILRDEVIPAISRRLDNLPSQEVTRKEHEDLQELIRTQHDDIHQRIVVQQQSIDHLEIRVDELIASMAKLQSGLEGHSYKPSVYQIDLEPK
jgi:hypothetical protein